MKPTLIVLLAVSVLPALAQNAAMTNGMDVKWGPHPFVKGGFLAVQSGDPGKGPSVLLMKFPKGMTIPAHTHTADETVTVVSGAAIFGSGEQVDPGKGTLLRSGAFLTIPGKAPHWAIVKETLVFTVTLTQAADFHLCGAK